MPVSISLSVNGRTFDVEVEPTEMLVNVLRERLGFVGTNKVCSQGICGACTVLLDGLATTSCLLLAAQADGCEVTTVEGLERDGELSVLQEAFLRHGAVQCGYCTPGFLMTATALLRNNGDPTRDEIVDGVRGNICRCTGYAKIVDAISSAAKTLRAAK
ncbi:MAG: (2Fe-2S)-binding protein [Xanthobacteraceae bacterium]|nr:(2Fe-2S)-binding protein [Xanthobacteraceae bacterium]